MSSGFSAIGQNVREHLDTTLDAKSHVALRASLVGAATRSGRPSTYKRGALVMLPAMAIAAVVLVFLNYPRPLSFSVDDVRMSGVVQATYHAAVDRERTLRFSDGSSVRIAPSSAVRVAETAPNGAMMEVIDGRLSVSVVPKKGSNWRLTAGPYTVYVTGTAFDIAWDDSQGRFAIAMREGQVRVHGPKLAGGKLLRHRERFEALVDGWQETPRKHSKGEAERGLPSRDDGSVHEPAPKVGASAAARSNEPPSSIDQQKAHRLQGGGTVPKSKAPALSDLVRAGRYDEVLQEAERRGVANLMQAGSLQDLAALADSARYARRPDLAERVLGRLRSRFPGSKQARSAAFVLGTIAESSNAAAALGWYEAYLSESPTGPLAAEALGRKVLLVHRLRGRDSAQQVAQEYLIRFPKGAHARHAREIIGQPDAAGE